MRSGTNWPLGKVKKFGLSRAMVSFTNQQGNAETDR